MRSSVNPSAKVRGRPSNKIERVKVLKCQNVKGREYRKILIIRLDRIGDVLLSTPVIKALRDRYPKNHIAFMVSPYAGDIVKGNPYLDEVIIYDKDGNGRGLFRNINFVYRLYKERFDLALILHPTLRTHLLVFFSAIPERVGYDKKSGWLLTMRIPHTKQLGLKHETDYTMDLLSYVGIEGSQRELYMPILPESEKRIRDIFKENGVGPDTTVIIINPGASCPSKRWPASNFAKVSDDLTAVYNARIFIISDLKDKSFADSVAGSMKSKAVNLAGMTSVADLASILKRSDLFISNDSGPVHIASAVGAPVIAIFGRSDRGLSPDRWAPRGERGIVLHKDIGCSICLAHNCKIGFKCLEAVTCEDVLNAAGEILGKEKREDS